MEKQKDMRSIAEVIIDGDGRYDNLIAVTKLRDGTYLIYEKEAVFGDNAGMARVHRLDSRYSLVLSFAKTMYVYDDPESKTIRRLNDLIMPMMK
jgi:hypothetical protein